LAHALVVGYFSCDSRELLFLSEDLTSFYNVITHKSEDNPLEYLFQQDLHKERQDLFRKTGELTTNLQWN